MRVTMIEHTTRRGVRHTGHRATGDTGLTATRATSSMRGNAAALPACAEQRWIGGADVSWIRTVPQAGASAELKPIYDSMRAHSSHGAVANLWQASALDPRGLAAMFAHYETLMREPAPLTKAQAELIALVVSATNGCAYCVAHHAPKYAAAVGDQAIARAVAKDYREANLSARDRVLLDCAVALTCEPAERKLEDIERLREYGLGDDAILKATEIAAFYNFINRMVCALGVELEPGVEAWEFGSQR
jgi:uncharacterized peroxidase-related enzyme